MQYCKNIHTYRSNLLQLGVGGNDVLIKNHDTNANEIKGPMPAELVKNSTVIWYMMVVHEILPYNLNL